MSLFRRNAASKQPPAPEPTHAFCESVHATATSPHHIREVGPEGLKLGGGVPNPALCGRDLRHGWDLKEDVTMESVNRLAQARPADGRVFLCQGCADAFRATH